MRVSRRQFFDRLREAAEGPHRWREKRIAQLREYALSHAPSGWTSAQREEAGRMVENKLAYMSDESLRGPDMKRYVEAVIQSKDLYFQTRPAEPGYGGADYDDPYHDDYYSG